MVNQLKLKRLKKMIIKSNIKTTAFLVLISVFFSCKRDDKVNILRDYFPDDRIESEYEYIIKGRDTILEGKFVSYYEKGGKKSEGNYVNNHLKGKFISYFENGNIQVKHYVLNSKVNLESIWNYPDGKIERYILADDYGSASFIVKFDKTGAVESSQGMPVFEFYHYKKENKKTLNVGDLLTYKYMVANIPNSKRKFTITLEDFDNKQIVRKMTNREPTIIEVEEVVVKKGHNTIKAKLEIEFNDKFKTMIKDSISFDFYVK